MLNKIQILGACWITNVFYTSSERAIQTLAGLASINLHINKYIKYAALHTCTLPFSHPFRTVLLKYWNVEDLNYVMLFSLEEMPNKVIILFRHIDYFSCIFSETFNLYYNKC